MPKSGNGINISKGDEVGILCKVEEDDEVSLLLSTTVSPNIKFRMPASHVVARPKLEEEQEKGA